MDSKMQLQKNAAVLTADGHQVGSLKKVVVNPNNRALNAIVVRVGNLFGWKEKVVPIKLVAEATKSQIVLNEEAGPVDTFLPFEQEYSIDEKNNADQLPPMENASISSGQPNADTPAIETLATNRMVSHIRQNIPEGTIAMEENAKVITLEGIYAGNVERVLVDPSDDRVTHLMVSNGLFTKAIKLIPIQWVTMMNSEQIHLSVKKSDVDELADVSQAG